MKSLIHNKKGQIEEIIVYAIVFVVLFFVGGIIGSLSLPTFPGMFYISGLVFSIFGTGAGIFIIKLVMH
ncbi:hypothetical protein AUJ68_04495 [Candidatus Woesearchaeota archaeon CG1_02_57_44]|nr:MAG: hypothetical protein AUJ68_04495 [Candidatus Woesearchaeota archaeon CG1_02_57_44]